ASCVLSPISTRKKASSVVPKTPRREPLPLKSLAPSGTSSHAPMATNDSARIQRMTSAATNVATQAPRAAASPWLASVATAIPSTIGTGRRYRAASISASNCVLSPISARATTPVETRKASSMAAIVADKKKSQGGNKPVPRAVLHPVPLKGDGYGGCDRSQGGSQAGGRGVRGMRVGTRGLRRHGGNDEGRFLLRATFGHALGLQGRGAQPGRGRHAAKSSRFRERALRATRFHRFYGRPDAYHRRREGAAPAPGGIPRHCLEAEQ